MEAAARRKEWRDRHLVASDQRGETAPGNLDEAHDSPALQHRTTPGQDVVSQGRERRGVGLAAGVTLFVIAPSSSSQRARLGVFVSGEQAGIAGVF